MVEPSGRLRENLTGLVFWRTKLPADSPHVESFVLRFVQDAPSDGASLWHAVVVHVQTDEEKSFTDFADAIAFISRYVPLGDFVFKLSKGDHP